MKAESTPNQQPPPPPGYYQSPPPPQYTQAPHPQTQQVPSNVNDIPGADCGLTGASQYKYAKAHDVFAGIFMGIGGWIVLQSLITFVRLVILQSVNTVQLGGAFYAGLAIDFGNGGLTLACGILIHLAVKSRQVPKLKLPLVLELIAAILMLIAFGLVVNGNIVYANITNGGVNAWYVLAAIIYGAEGVCYILHIILGVIEIMEWNKRVEIGQRNPENTVKYSNFP